MIARTVQLAVLSLCVLLLAGCGKEAPKTANEIDFGSIQNSVYRNDYFGLTLAIPAKWSVQDQKTLKKLSETGAKMVAGDDKNMKAVMSASALRTVNLVAVFQHPLGTPIPYNPSIACVAERVSDAPGIKQGKDYHFHTKQIMQSSQTKFAFPKDMTTEKLGGIDFDVMHATVTVGATTIQQKYYSAIMKGYALNFIASFTNAEEEAALQKVLEGVSFKPQ
jgi:hypothetical protein